MLNCKSSPLLNFCSFPGPSCPVQLRRGSTSRCRSQLGSQALALSSVRHSGNHQETASGMSALCCCSSTPANRNPLTVGRTCSTLLLSLSLSSEPGCDWCFGNHELGQLILGNLGLARTHKSRVGGLRLHAAKSLQQRTLDSQSKQRRFLDSGALQMANGFRSI